MADCVSKYSNVYSNFTFVKHGKDTLIDIIIYENNALPCLFNKFRYKIIGVKNLSIIENALRWKIVLIYATEYFIYTFYLFFPDVASSSTDDIRLFPFVESSVHYWPKIARIAVNARMIRILTPIAIGERSTPLNMAMPFSVNA